LIIELLTKYAQVAAQQYYSIAEILLTLYNPLHPGAQFGEPERQFAEDHALRVCGLAFTNDNVAARVNAFGPLSFCEYYSISNKMPLLMTRASGLIMN
jgi:hypothetical protein